MLAIIANAAIEVKEFFAHLGVGAGIGAAIGTVFAFVASAEADRSENMTGGAIIGGLLGFFSGGGVYFA